MPTVNQTPPHPDLAQRAKSLFASLGHCTICPRRCGVDRLDDEIGFCGVGEAAVVASAAPHFGEEDVLVGSGGSGTIFFAGCNLRCIFCQNYDISHQAAGSPLLPEDLAGLMLRLQGMGCANVNFVTPTHVTPQVMLAILSARARGLHVPVVYNCGGYESVETLQALEGFVDIYMPDAKYDDGNVASQLSDAPDYPDVMRAALLEMHRQVGDLVVEDGLATRGLLVRHLVLPDDMAGSRGVLDFVAREVSPDTFVNVMGQYRPCYQADRCEPIARRPTQEEFLDAYEYARGLGLRLAR